MNKRLDISVVVPLFNEAESLPELVSWIDRVAHENSLTYEVIMVNDGSTDRSEAVVQDIIKRYPESNIKLINQENRGVSAARNRGIEEACGEYVALLDADDWWLSNYIAEVCRLMEYYPDCDAYSTSFYIVNRGRRVRASVPTAEGIIDPATEALQGRYPIIPSKATLRRKMVESVGGFPEGMRLGEDQWLWVKMVQQEAKFCFSPMSLVRYSRTASNRSAAIYRAEQSEHTLEELYTPNGDTTLNEYIARIAIGKAITQSVRGGTEDARHAAEVFAYTTRSRRQLRRLRLLNALPKALRPVVDGLYALLAWAISRKGL